MLKYCDVQHTWHVLLVCDIDRWQADTVEQSFDFQLKNTPRLPLPMPRKKGAGMHADDDVQHLRAKSDLHGHSSLDSPALQVVPEMDLRVDEDKEASFLVFLEGFAGKSAGPQHS